MSDTTASQTKTFEYYENLTLPNCSKCQSNKVQMIIYGFPTQELLQYAMNPNSRVTLGGCVPNDEKYYCKNCNEYYD